VDYPLVGDQTLFLMGAKTIHSGGLLYRDFWDIKPPGIFLWYMAGGSLFGYSDLGIHLFDLLYQSAFALSIVLMLRPIWGMRTGALAALFTVGWYYVFCTERQLSNLEPLVQFPLFFTLGSLARVRVSRHPHLWLVGAGVSTGVVFVFKPVLCLISVVLWGLWLQDRRAWLRAVSGAAIPIVAILVWFLIHGEVGRLLEVMFVTPLEVVQEKGPRPLGQMPSLGLLWWFKRALPLVVFGLGAFAFRDSRKDRLAVSCLAWLCSGSAAIGIQVRSWWDYQWVLLVCPLAVLSARTADSLLRRIGSLRQRIAIGIVLGLAAVPAGKKVLAMNPDPRDGPYYKAVQEEVRFLQTQPPGRILVFAAPDIYYRSGRQAASSVHTMPPVWSRSQLDRVCSEVRKSAPVLVLIPHWLKRTISSTPCLLAFMENYEVTRQSALGTWYRPRGAGNTRSRAANFFRPGRPDTEAKAAIGQAPAMEESLRSPWRPTLCRG
jgi:hypothetical protein